MFAIHDVFRPTERLPKIDGPVRVIATVGLEKVILIAVCEGESTVPFAAAYRDWLEYLNSGALERTADPDLNLLSSPRTLPPSAAKRYKQMLKFAEVFSQDPSSLYGPRSFAATVAEIARVNGLNGRTVRRWVCDWLRSGRNPAAVVRKFLQRESNPTTKSQVKGKKRGAKARVPESVSDAPAHEVAENIKYAWDWYVIKQRKTWLDAYHQMLIDRYKLPEEAFSPEHKGYFLDRVLIEKYRAPTWPQVRYRFRRLKLAACKQDPELPQGKRGKATDDAFGPGFFEIDATHFQIQLVSRLTKCKLVGRPTVYLVVDIFSGAITGYSVTLENPSWAAAALALFNCFTSKGAVFERLGLPYEARDWPCQELPNMLRADRAELVSNMGQEFPSSGIRVETPPPMNPQAKGTVEGKHSEIKKPQRGRFDLPGRFAKIRKRRDPDGKKAAALDIFEFERILVEIILDINREPVDARRIPPDALSEGAKVASRIGFYAWGLTQRAGFTRTIGPNFVYEHLLTTANSTVTPKGLRLRGEIFNCDRLRQLGHLTASIDHEVKLGVAYNPFLASEIYFHDRERDTWEPAYNIDPEIDRLKASFSEAENFRSWQKVFAQQAALNAHGKRNTRLRYIRQTIKDAVKAKQQTPGKGYATKANIRENRAQERANERSSALYGAQATTPPPQPANNQPTNNSAGTPSKVNQADKNRQLWSKVNVISAS